MPDAAPSPLTAWESFYVIMGSTAAVLTGLVFVAVTLIVDDRPRNSGQHTEEGIAAFNTPTVVHFCAVLLVSAILSAPWHALSNAGLALGLTGAGGITYTLLTGRRLRRQTGYQPVLEDWLWHTLSPLVAYVLLVVLAFALPRVPARALFGIGAVAISLLFIGLHNAWDIMTYIAVQRVQGWPERRE